MTTSTVLADSMMKFQIPVWLLLGIGILVVLIAVRLGVFDD